MAKADASPGFLTAAPTVARMSKKPLYLAVIGLSCMLAVLIYSVNFLHDPNAAKEEEQKKIDVPQPAEKPLVPSDAGHGLALPEPEPEPVISKEEPLPKGYPSPIQVIVPEKAPAWQQEMENIRRMKMQAEYAALSSPLAAKKGSSGQSGDAPDQPNGQANIGQPTRPESVLPDPYSVRESQYDPSADKDKEAFLGRTSTHDAAWILPHARTAGQPLELKTGAVIPGVMITGINSDLPGNIIGQVAQHVWDTATGRKLLIPQGAKLFGTYDSRVIFGQERVLVAWNRIIFPDGSAMTLGAMPGADIAGNAGYMDEVTNHYLRIFGSAMLMSLITGGMSYTMDTLNTSGNSNSQYGTSTPSLQEEMGSALAAQLGQATMQLLQKNLSIKPTLEIRPGYRFTIVVTKDLVFQSSYTAWRR